MSLNLHNTQLKTQPILAPAPNLKLSTWTKGVTKFLLSSDKFAFHRMLLAHLDILFALADGLNNYLSIIFTRDVTPRRFYQKHNPFYLQFGF